MRKPTLTLITTIAILTSVPFSWALAQSTVQANFGVDADIHANRTERPDTVAGTDTDDWFYDSGGSGIGVIDTVGGGLFRALLQAGDITGRNKTFVRRMDPNVGPLNIDAVYTRDHHSVGEAMDTSTFNSGSNKNADNPLTWATGAGSTPTKNDIVDAAAHLRRDDNDSLWLLGYMTTMSSDGNSHLDFEFFATDAQYDTGTGFTGLGPDSGHTIWTFDGSGNVTQTGDVIFVVDFEQGGTAPSKSMYIWIHQDDLVLDPVPFDFSGTFESGLQSGSFGYAEIVPVSGAEFAYAVVNIPQPDGNGNTEAAPWGSLEGSSAAFNDSILQTQLTEIGVNLSALGLTGGEVNPCVDIVLGNILFKSRSSSSFTSELKDFVGPQGFGFFTSQCEIECPGDMMVECVDDIPLAATSRAEFLAQGGSISSCLDPVYITHVDGSLSGGPCGGQVVRTYMLSDSCGQADTCEQIFTVDDTTQPVIICPPDTVFECDAIGDPGVATATDSCDPDPTITYTDVVTPGACPRDSTITRTWVATDDCGNADTCVQTITIHDTTPPVITCPPDTALECGSGDFGVATAVDNCDPDPVITSFDDTVSIDCPFQIERTWIATDDCGNADTCVQTITVDDTTPPVITCPPDTVFECNAIGDFGIATATDNCDLDPTITYTEVVTYGTCPQDSTITRTWVATDDCGNADTCVQTITIQDSTPPVITCPPDTVFECDAIGDPGTATATDNCDPDPVVTYTDVVTPGSCPEDSTITRTWVATDDCGNADTCVQTITIHDTTPPVIICPPDTVFECDAIGDPGTATATDNCDPDPVVTYTDVVTPGSCPEDSTITRTWVATDNCGNADTCVQIITIQDTTPPVITCPPDTALDCGSGDFGVATAVDNCDPDPEITFSDDTVSIDCPFQIERTWVATDDCGNADTCVQSITVDDTIPPVITCPPDTVFECDAIGDPGVATATDNCDLDPTITYTDVVASGSCPNDSTITRTWVATDDCGNADTCVQTITIRDETPPVIICPPDTVFECDAIGDFGTATASDNCDPDPAVTYTDVVTPGSCPQDSTITRTWVATDACGNADTCVQTITIQDSTPPVIACPPDTAFECDDIGDPGTATADDNCDPDPTVTYTDVVTPGSCPQDSTITRTWVATDDCGNADTCVQTITIHDTTPPAITCPPDTSLECGNGDLGVATAVDNCDPDPEVTFFDDTISVVCPFQIERNWVATDDCGNADTCIQTITIDDTTVPEITCPPDHVFECDSIGDFGTATATDNCDPDPSVTYTDVVTPGACPHDSTITRTWVAMDYCGNADTCVQTITIHDSTPPEITCPPDTVFECGAVGDPGTATATDNCDPDPAVTYTDVVTPGTCPRDTTITRTWVAADICGNADTCVQIITIQDNTPPEITCPPDTVFECDDIGDFGTATATDNCDPDPSVTYTDVVTPGSCPQDSTITRTWVARDVCGNADTCVQTITIHDTTPPVIDCPPNLVFYCNNVGDFGTAMADDNCDPNPSLTYTDVVTPGACEGEYTVRRTWVATDACGNSDSCEQVVVVMCDCEECVVTIKIEKTHDTYQGHYEYVSITVVDSSYLMMGGFDFLIAYDASALTFMEATPGQLLEDCGWEYFTYRHGWQGNCDGPCPSGLLRIVAIADINNGANHPSCFGVFDADPYELAEMKFYVTNDRTFECMYVPIRFFWHDCGDNSVSNMMGDTLWISDRVYDFEGNEVTGMIHYGGHWWLGDCQNPDTTKPSPVPCIDFIHGGIDIICSDSIDAPGDINLNEIPNEVADAVLFTNYFIHGLGVFDINPEGQIAATDVNNDGRVLTVGDLVYLIRLITGDAVPFGRISRFSGEVSVDLTSASGGPLEVATSSLSDIGAAYFVFAADDPMSGAEVTLSGDCESFSLLSDVVDGQLKVLVYSIGKDRIPPGDNVLFTVDCGGEITLVECDMVDYYGSELKVNVERPTVPVDFAVSQNFPNPFNPETEIMLSLPYASHWTITIYNIAGRVVKTLGGFSEAGVDVVKWYGRDDSGREVASGVYFYKVCVGEEYTVTKKMLLLK